MAQTCPLIAPVQPILHRDSCRNKILPNAPKHYENAPKQEFRVQWGGSGVFAAKKIQCEYVARTFALIAQVQPVLHRVSCSNETIQNAPKYYKTNQYMILGSKGVDRVRSLRKFQCDFMAQTCALIAPVQPILYLVSCSNETLTNTPKHYEKGPNIEFRVQ